MEILDIENCLKSLKILVDTREQPSERAFQRYKSFGVPYRRQKLNYGDYAYTFTLPNGQDLYDADDAVDADCIIERKMNLEELSACFCQSRDRFKREFERAKEHNASIYLIIEDGNWMKLLTGKYKTKFNSKAFTSSLIAWMIRYNIKPIFVNHELSGQVIKEILYRELKDRLERGLYD